MATITVKRIIDRVSDIIQSTETDEDDRSFPESDLVEYYNLEIRGLISDFPDAYAITRAVKLAAGVEQYIPNDGIALLTATMNMGTDGETPGTPIVLCDLASIQRSDRSWNTSTAQEEVYNVMPDPADPRHFWVYPQSDGTGYISEEFSGVPDTVVWDEDGDWETSVVPIIEKYVHKLEKRIISRCYKRDTDIPGNLIRENDNQQEGGQGGN